MAPGVKNQIWTNMTKDEAYAAGGALKRKFKKADDNENGVISAKELAHYYDPNSTSVASIVLFPGLTLDECPEGLEKEYKKLAKLDGNIDDLSDEDFYALKRKTKRNTGIFCSLYTGTIASLIINFANSSFNCLSAFAPRSGTFVSRPNFPTEI